MEKTTHSCKIGWPVRRTESQRFSPGLGFHGEWQFHDIPYLIVHHHRARSHIITNFIVRDMRHLQLLSLTLIAVGITQVCNPLKDNLAIAPPSKHGANLAIAPPSKHRAKLAIAPSSAHECRWIHGQCIDVGTAAIGMTIVGDMAMGITHVGNPRKSAC